jgi:hypothetical protein
MSAIGTGLRRCHKVVAAGESCSWLDHQTKVARHDPLSAQEVPTRRTTALVLAAVLLPARAAAAPPPNCGRPASGSASGSRVHCFIGTETVSLILYTGDPDRIVSMEAVDPA